MSGAVAVELLMFVCLFFFFLTWKRSRTRVVSWAGILKCRHLNCVAIRLALHRIRNPSLRKRRPFYGILETCLFIPTKTYYRNPEFCTPTKSSRAYLCYSSAYIIECFLCIYSLLTLLIFHNYSNNFFFVIWFERVGSWYWIYFKDYILSSW